MKYIDIEQPTMGDICTYAKKVNLIDCMLSPIVAIIDAGLNIFYRLVRKDDDDGYCGIVYRRDSEQGYLLLTHCMTHNISYNTMSNTVSNTMSNTTGGMLSNSNKLKMD